MKFTRLLLLALLALYTESIQAAAGGNGMGMGMGPPCGGPSPWSPPCPVPVNDLWVLLFLLGGVYVVIRKSTIQKVFLKK